MRESQPMAAERHDRAAHAHRSGTVHHGKQDRRTGHESSRQGLEHSNQAYLTSQKERQENTTGHDAAAIAHQAKEQEIAVLAYELWQGRCCPEGSPEEDWCLAVKTLRSGQ